MWNVSTKLSKTGIFYPRGAHAFGIISNISIISRPHTAHSNASSTGKSSEKQGEGMIDWPGCQCFMKMFLFIVFLVCKPHGVFSVVVVSYRARKMRKP